MQLPCGSGCARLATLAFASPLPQGSWAWRTQSHLQKDFYTGCEDWRFQMISLMKLFSPMISSSITFT